MLFQLKKRQALLIPLNDLSDFAQTKMLTGSSRGHPEAGLESASCRMLSHNPLIQSSMNMRRDQIYTFFFVQGGSDHCSGLDFILLIFMIKRLAQK